MDGGNNHPQGYSNYGQDWTSIQGRNGGDDVPELGELSFTGSQTQAIASIIDDPTLFNLQHEPGLDHEIFGPPVPGFDAYHQGNEHFVMDPNHHHQLFEHTNQHCPPEHLASSVTPTPSSLQGVPPMENWPGEYAYTVEFCKAQDKTKATPWVYSSKLSKLFVSLDKACPISFRASFPGQYFSHYQIRGQVLYSRPEDFQDAVERCINHQQKDPAVVVHAAHVLRCDDAGAKYFDHDQKRHSVVVALKPPAPGTNSVTLCFRFMCLSSCIGSLNRRPTHLVFTLEHIDNGMEVGRFSCPVRICSCPGRDVRSEEDKFVPDESSTHVPRVEVDSNGQALIPIHFPPKAGKNKKRKLAPPLLPTPRPASNDDEVFHLSVDIRGRRQFEAIKEMIETMMRAFNDLTANNTEGNPVSNPTNEPKRFKEEP